MSPTNGAPSRPCRAAMGRCWIGGRSKRRGCRRSVFTGKTPGSTPPGGGGLLALGKGGMVTLQRMETPVIYFYADERQMLDVQVDFPQGQITEWYPQAS